MYNETEQTTPAMQAEENQAFSAPTPAPQQTEEQVGFWTFLGLIVLFTIPVIGFISCIVMMFAPRKKTLKNYARAAFTWLMVRLVAAILILSLMVGIIGNLVLPILNEQLGTDLGNLFEIVGLANDLKKGNYSAVINQFRAPLLEALGEEYAPLLDEFATGKYDDLIEQIKEGDYDDILEDLQEGEYQGLVEKIGEEDYNAFRNELQAAANGQPSPLFDEIRGYLNNLPINF